MVTVASRATVTILLSSEEPGPIVEAAQDLQSDFAKVLGKKPRIVRHMEDAAPVTVLIGEESKLPEGLRSAGLTEPESFFISLAHGPEGKSQPNKVVLLAAADMRGTIYAIYRLSEEFVGADPLYYWNDHDPLRRAPIELPAALDKHFPAPVFKYPGFFR